jgi:hypothetical protein
VISSPRGSSQCGANKVQRINPQRYAIIKRLQLIYIQGDLLAFLEPFCFGLFGDFIPRGKNVRPKQASGSKDMRPKGENVNIGREDQKGEV